jgi:hypothetical protein
MRQRATLATSIAAILMLFGPDAVADVAQAQCLDANTSAQSLRQDGKLAEARAMLAVCGDPQCPALVRDDCTRRTEEIEHAQPTIQFVVKDRAGRDLGAVRVSVDGRVLAEKLEGSPLSADPGEHTFTFEVAGQPPVTQTFVLREGEKQRTERVTLGAPIVVATETPARHVSTQRTLGIVGMSLGAVGVAVGGVFGLLASSAWNTTKSECGSPQVCPNYNQAVLDHASTMTDSTLSTVSLIAGAALLVGGGALFFTAGPSTTVTPDVGPNAASLTLKGSF